MTEPAELIQPGREWNGYQTWQCRQCKYNDTDYGRAVGHAADVHLPKPPQKSVVKSRLVDPKGRPLFMEVTHDGY